MNRHLFKAILSFALWGLFPLYFNLLGDLPPYLILASRIICSFFFSILLILIFKRTKILYKILKNKNYLIITFLSSIPIATNWFVFIYAITINQVLETSLGYFTAPLISIFFGLVFLKEKIGIFKKIALFLVILAISYKVYIYGSLPWISLSLAISFAFYGFFKKYLKGDSLVNFSVEMSSLLPIGLFYFFFNYEKIKFYSNDPKTVLLLLGLGIVSTTPLLLFISSLKKVKLSSIGFINFITPSISFLLGIFYFQERFTINELVVFSLIWIGLLITSLDQFYFKKKN